MIHLFLFGQLSPYLDKQQLHTCLADVVATHVYHQLHVRVPVLGGLAPGTYLIHPGDLILTGPDVMLLYLCNNHIDQ